MFHVVSIFFSTYGKEKKLLVFHFWNRNAFISPLNLKKAEIKPKVTFSSLINLFPFLSFPCLLPYRRKSFPFEFALKQPLCVLF